MTFGFESFGVKVQVESPDEELSAKIKMRLGLVFDHCIEFDNSEGYDHLFRIDREIGTDLVVVDEGSGNKHAFSADDFIDRFESLLRIHVAEHAEDRVFIHAGVVAINDTAIILPGRSMTGKTTLVYELVKAGAVYYSDEYAVLDTEARVHPFSKPLSVRKDSDDKRQSDVDVKELGGKRGRAALECSLVLLTRYEKGGEFNPVTLSPGRGILEVMSNTVPVRRNPEFSLKVLNKLALRAIIADSCRGEASETADLIKKYIDRPGIITS